MPAGTRNRSHYQSLGVPRDADVPQIQRAYRSLARSLHPDAGKTADEARFIEITRAYEVLSDEVRRREYDALLDSSAADRRAAQGGHYTWANVAAPSPPPDLGRRHIREIDDLYDTFFGERSVP